jgi:DNA-binding beta-propeller fold protein YncE
VRVINALPVVCLGLLFLMAIEGCSKQSMPTGPVAELVTHYEFARAWGDSGSGSGQFFRPHGAAVDASGNVYVVDLGNSRIQKFSRDGAYVTQWGTWGKGDGQFGSFTNIAVDGSGDVYVADSGNNRIQKFTSDGSYLTQWAVPGTGNRELDGNLYGIAVDPSGSVFVMDSGHGHVLKFTRDGTFVTQWGETGYGDGRFMWSRGMGVDAHGHVYVADGERGIQMFSTDGAFLKRWDIRGARYYGADHMTVDADGNVIVTDIQSHTIKRFNSAGWLLTQWAPRGGWNWTPAVAVGGDGTVYVTSTEENRIEKYAPVLR